MRVIIIGTIVKDFLQFYNGSSSSSFGGLMHTINSAKSVLGNDDLIIPVSFVGSDVIDDLMKLFSGDSQISVSGLIPFNGQNNTVMLDYFSDSERVEKSLHPMPAIEYENLGKIFPADLVIINMISGWDISLDCLQKLRKNYSGIIAMDLHSLTLKREEDGTRKYIQRDDLSDWILNIDLLQMNEKEYNILAGSDVPPEKYFEETCVNKGKIINLTKGHKGSTTYFKSGNQSKIHNQNVPAKINVLDPTGCGDAFLAAFSIRYVQTSNVKLAAEHANIIAALSGSFKGLADPDIMKEKMLYLAEEVQ